jgi:1-acyl-sn-glycerol-3-phosphate acyltransferase
VVRPALSVAYRLHISGAERFPDRGGVVVVANHLSALDPFVLGVAVPRDLRFLAKEELWRSPVLGWAMDRLGGFPVGRGRGDRDALATAAELLRDGQAVGVFPQGAVRTDGPWLRGAARMALTAGVPVVPVRLFDTDRALAGRRLGLPKVRVVIGEPIPVAPAATTIAAARELTARLRAAVESLADPVA